MRRILLFSLFCMLLAPIMVTAQDPQFSQFYAAPLYLNPAFAGNTQQARVGLNYRNQWPSIDANFQTFSAYFDTFIEDKNSGVGLLMMHDSEGQAGLNSTSVGLQYAYQLYITEWLSFRPGFQVAWYNRNINFSDLTFGDQFDENGQISNPSAETFGNTSKNFIDLSAGGVLYTKNAWLGVAVNHLNTPNQSFEDDSDPKELPMKTSFHGGVKIHFNPGTMGSGLYARPQERSLTPTFQYKMQGEFDQLDLGLYLTLEPIIIGTWYRGLPMKSIEGFSNNESIVMLVGFTQKGGKGEVLNIGYSYDYTISQLGSASGGAHELSLSYSWSNRDPRKPPKNVMQIPCPDF